ncbi:hypothetical protein [Kitasatospora sp. NPDC093558]|uniref:hypothetical protein n=1 Tax=Kitasatospora sp. NPDC093558 TaxID=3155201 RepID=UPI00344884C8
MPGRGLADEQLHFLTALPRIDGTGDADDLADGVADLVEAVDDRWTGPRAPQVRMLPLMLEVAELPTPEGRLRIALGLEDREVSALWHDFEESPDLVVIGDSETGKTNLLHHLVNGITTTYTPAEARITRAMEGRVPSEDVTPARLKLRDRWTGPELFILVDDYDLITAPLTGHPFAPLLDRPSRAPNWASTSSSPAAPTASRGPWPTPSFADSWTSTPLPSCSPARPARASSSAASSPANCPRPGPAHHAPPHGAVADGAGPGHGGRRGDGLIPWPHDGDLHNTGGEPPCGWGPYSWAGPPTGWIPMNDQPDERSGRRTPMAEVEPHRTSARTGRTHRTTSDQVVSDRAVAGVVSHRPVSALGAR